VNSRIIAVAALGLAIGGCGASTPPPAGKAPAAKTAAAVDAARLIGADTEPGNWMAPGRTYGEQHFSPLNKIDADNVKGLGLAWYYDLNVAHRAQEATPLVIDGVMYITGAWSKVFALDAKSGAPLWTYDPKVPGQVGVNACCDSVNRGAG
jgi:quinohemoprotein ethanol dehydrogenase